MQQFLRKIRVSVKGSSNFVVNGSGRVTEDELRIAVNAKRTLSGSPNTFTVKFWNLSKDNAKALGTELDEVTVEAGYIPVGSPGNVGIIANGFIRDVKHDLEGNDLITTITCGDGDKTYRSATVSETFPKGTKVESIVDAIYSAIEPFGVSKGEWKFPNELRTFKRPYSICGPFARELDLLGRGGKFYWTIQNGSLDIFPGNGKLSGKVNVSKDTGLIGVPTLTDNGIKFSMLLNPAVQIGRTIGVQSEMLDLNSKGSEYRIGEINFSADNTQGEFKADISGEEISGSEVNEGVKP